MSKDTSPSHVILKGGTPRGRKEQASLLKRSEKRDNTAVYIEDSGVAS